MEKKLALYLYITPFFTHSPGVTVGHIMGNVLRIYQLCTQQGDIQSKLDKFFVHLLNRGHQHSNLPLFDKAIHNASEYQPRSDSKTLAAKLLQAEAAERQVYFHLPYHPINPPANII